MNESFSIIFLLFITGYIFGSFPSGVIISKLFFGFDIRTQGSGNMGSTNVFRVLGTKWGIIVQVLDLLKGYLPVVLLPYLIFQIYSNEFNISINPNQLLFYKLFIGISSVLGHVFSVFVSFKGGKGINTSVGMMLAIAPIDIGFTFLTFLILILLYGMVSLGSVIGAIVLPLSLLIRHFIFGVKIEGFETLIIFSSLLTLLVIITHRANIRRILKGEESKFEKLMFKNLVKKLKK